MAKILTYGLPEEKQASLQDIARDTIFTIRPVQTEEMGERVGYLVGLEGYTPTGEDPREPIEIEMMLFAQAERDAVYPFIDAMRERGLKIDHKANLTETTKDWIFYDLLTHMVEEKSQITAHLKNQQQSNGER